jgi:hypothetical protein
MNVNALAADDADEAPANDAADDDEDDGNGSVVNVADEMELALGYIGFDNAIVRNRLRNEGLQDFSDMKSLKEKDIRDIAESFTKRTVGDGRFLFGIRRTRLLIGMVHWVQDFARVGETPSMNNYLGHPGLFRDALTVASDRADVRKIELDQSDTVSKAADPGKFKDERKWPEWEPSSTVSMVYHCLTSCALRKLLIRAPTTKVLTSVQLLVLLFLDRLIRPIPARFISY